MRTFDEIFTIAANRKGGVDALEAMLTPPMSRDVLAKTPDDRFLIEDETALAVLALLAGDAR